MRHAFDADHIAAIDNTTRKLMSEGKRPLSTGFWFSLGHSSVVFALALLLSVGIRSLAGPVENDGSGLHGVTGLVGTLVSGTFLYLIAALNVVILVGILKVFRAMKRGTYDEAALEEHLNNRGLMNRYLGRVTRSVTKPSQMYPIGILFGLGFDTATEVALLVLAGGAAGAGLPWYAILTLPVLFAAGMSLLDSIDGSFMNFAYGWAFSKPVRKVFYNLTITGLSVAIALVIGTIELGGLLAAKAQSLGHVLDLVRVDRHQPARLRDRRPLRRDLARRARDLALSAGSRSAGRCTSADKPEPLAQLRRPLRSPRAAARARRRPRRHACAGSSRRSRRALPQPRRRARRGSRRAPPGRSRPSRCSRC